MGSHENALKKTLDILSKESGIIAILLCGSMHYSYVTEKSNINLVIITDDAKKITPNLQIEVDDVVVLLDFYNRKTFIEMTARNKGGTIEHAYLSNSRLVYVKDKIFEDLIEDNLTVGQHDLNEAIFYEACEILLYLHDIEQWMEQNDDCINAQFVFVYMSRHIARLEHFFANSVLKKEVLMSAYEINTDVMDKFNKFSLTHMWNREDYEKMRRDVYAYLEMHIDKFAKHVVRAFDAHEVLSLNELSMAMGGVRSDVIKPCLDLMTNIGLLFRTTLAVPISYKSRIEVDEIAYGLVR